MPAEPHAVIRIIHVSDTHLGFDLPVHPRVNRPRRGEDFFSNFTCVLNYAREKKADYLVHGGDLFYRSRVPAGLVNRVYGMLQKAAADGLKIIIVPGNHERSNLPVSLFLRDPDIYIFDRPRSFVFSHDGCRIAFSGFPFQPGSIRKSFKTLLKDTGWRVDGCAARFLCLHQTIEGAAVGPVDFRFRNGPQTIPVGYIPEGFTAVLLGHIHRAQILYRRFPGKIISVPLIYSGSVERTSAAERNELKGFYDLELQFDPMGKIVYTGVRFMQLPSRPWRRVEIRDGIRIWQAVMQ